MENLVYYPKFEPENENWLKYSLLYINNFTTIVPYRAKKELTPIINRISEETDMVEFYEPQYGEALIATNKFKSDLQNIEDTVTCNEMYDFRKLKREWRKRGNWNSTILNEKFNDELISYCKENKFGQIDKNDNDLRCSSSFSKLYMSYLAEEIALKKESSIITDIQESHSALMKLRQDTESSEVVFGEAVIKKTVPDLKNVDINKLIKFRNERETLQLRQAFITEVELLLQNLNDIPTSEGFIKNYEYASKEFYYYISKFWGNIVLDLSLTCLFPVSAPIAFIGLAKLVKTAVKISLSAEKYKQEYAELKRKKNVNDYLVKIDNLKKV